MRKIQEDNLPNEDITQLLTALQHLGIVRVGKLRAHWLLYEKPYHVFEESILGLLADLLLALATMARVSGADVVIIEDGRVEFKRAGRTVASFHCCFWERSSRRRCTLWSRFRKQFLHFREQRIQIDEGFR